MPAELRAAIVGYGSLGRRRAGFFDAAGVPVAHVVDTDTSALETARAQWPRTRFWPDFSAFSRYLQDADQTAAQLVVNVAAPHQQHRDLCVEALALGAHVLCEKPAGVGLNEVREVVGAAASAGRVLHVAANHLCLPGVAAWLGWLAQDAEQLGAIERMTFTVGHDRLAQMQGWRLAPGGGALRDNGWHAFALLHGALSLLGQRLAEVSLQESALAPGGVVDAETVVGLRTAAGAHGSLTATWRAAGAYVLEAEIEGAGGVLRLQSPAVATWQPRGGEQRALQDPRADPLHSWEADTAAFLQAVRAGAVVPRNLERALVVAGWTDLATAQDR